MSDPLKRRLIDLVKHSERFMHWLRCARTLGLDDWCIGAGAVRELVWDAMHDTPMPPMPADVDLAFFDRCDTTIDRDGALRERLRAVDPSIPWDVTNQAGVHLWFETRFGHAVAPLRSLDEAVASWPEFATAVGIALRADDTVRVLAPHGLDDLFGLVVRRNPTRVSIATYRERVAQKRYAERWPKVTVIAC